MPSTRPQAAFEPLAPNIDIRALVESTPNFEWASRIHCDMIHHHGLDQFEKLILMHVVLGGKPLIIEGYESKLDKWTFSVQWLRDNWGLKVVDARDLTAGKNVPLTIQHYLKHMPLLTNQWDDKNYKDQGRQRMYLKDIDCHPIWAEKVRDQIPFGLFYFNDSIGDYGGLGAVDEAETNGPGTRRGRGAAKAGDLMSNLPKEMRAENLMCYIGHEGTYTPAHREMCASLGHNIMVEASTANVEDGKLTKPGSSIWFMTETKDREVVSEYWLSRLGHDIEIEKHFAQINAWKHAPFKVWVVEQKPGDLILIPPLAPHQVWNRGTRTMKVAWNRTTVETLEMALNEALPKARMVCRDEQYKNKAIIFYSLQKYSKSLQAAEKQKKQGLRPEQSDAKVRQLLKDFKRLQIMFTSILVSESFSSAKPETKVEMVPFESNITCSYCRCNIFNRFLTCSNCVGKLPDGEEDTYDVCMECYAMGRSCMCISKLKWVEQWAWEDLKGKHEQWRRQIIEIEGKVDPKLPKSLNTEVSLLGKKRTLAQICQLELARRPFHDIKKDKEAPEKRNGDIEREEIDEVDANGNVRKKRKIRRSEKYIREHGRCHVDCYWEPKWKQANCSKCDKNYCYGNLYRAYDEMPQDILADPKWKCPSCRLICGCRHCKNKPGFKQYMPKGTLLGHNTKSVADPRSVESLVDFSYPNLGWIQKAGDDLEEDTVRLRRRLRQAEAAKANEPRLEDNYVDGEAAETTMVENRLLQLAEQEGIPIDPALADAGLTAAGVADMMIEDEETFVEHPEEPWWESSLPLPEQLSVPEGGVMWNNEHAYDNINEITYVYPEIALSTQLPPPPAEGFTPTIIPGYEPAATESNERIEMIERKRRRAKLDEGDRPYMYKKAVSKTKNRKSLVIRLAINRDRLRAFGEASANTESVPVASVTPVVGSDLQALNLDQHGAGPAPVVRTVHADNDEMLVDEQDDDDFTPSRYRDRRKTNPDGTPRSPPTTDTTRRTTRMQTVTYVEPDENDFDDAFESTENNSKLATMQGAIRELDPKQRLDKPATVGAQAIQQSSNVSDPPLPIVHPKGLDASAGSIATLSSSSRGQVQINASKGNGAFIGAQPRSSPRSRSISSGLQSNYVDPKVAKDANANRRAKMAAMDGAMDSTDSSTTEAESDSSQPSTPDMPTTVPQKPVVRSSFGSKAPRLSLPSAHPAQEPLPPLKKQTTTTTASRAVATVPKPVAAAPAKAIAADWADSSSEDDSPPFRNPVKSQYGSGFTAVNAKIGHHISQAISRGSRGKRIGRPSGMR